MKSIKLKVVIIYLALVFIVMLMWGTFMILDIRMQETDKLKESVKDYVNLVLIPVIENYDEEDFQEEFGEEIIFPGLKGYILNDRGQTIAPEEGKYSFTPQNNRKSVVLAAMAGDVGFSMNRWGIDINNLNSKQMEYAAPVQKGNVTYIIFVRCSLEEMYTRISQLTQTITISVVLALLLTGLLGVLFANTITGPIILLTKKSKELAAGKLNEKIEVKSNDEIGQLTESFNDMSSELNKTLESINAEKNKQEILLHNMTDGVLAYDKNGRLIHGNFTSSELLGIPNLQELSFSEMATHLGSEPLTPEAFEVDSLKEFTTAIGDRFVSSIFTPYFNKYKELDGIVVVLQDITKHKKLDNMRKEFVANVSHEIRTPLTTIKSYTETLLDGAMDDPHIRKEFLGIIEKEADRMELLVHDLLELSRFDNKQFNLHLEEVNMVDLVHTSIKQIRLLAEKKNQRIQFTPPPEPCYVNADSSRITQVLINIIGNSIKYSPEGAEITMFIEQSERYYRIYIRDTGMGIPKDDLKRIFERFYRVDKARSRAMGGTGLGLSIANEIMEAHGGRISVSSEVGQGTTMVLRFNKEWNNAEKSKDVNEK